MIRLSAFAALAFIFSCSILEDTDITSSDQLAGLNLTGFEIRQQTADGNVTSRASLISTTDTLLTDPNTGAEISRILRYSLQALSLRIKLRSGVTTTTEFSVSYTKQGKPYTAIIWAGDSAVEIYRFRYENYTATGKLNLLHTTINPVDNLPPIANTRDAITYNGSGLISSISRNEGAGTFSITYGGGAPPVMSNISISGVNYQQNTGYGTGCTESACLIAYHISGAGGFGVGIRYINRTENTFNDFMGLEYSCCGFEPSIYNFHPLFFLHSQLDTGGQLMIIYMKDWWIQGAQNSSISGSVRELVEIVRTYGL